MNAPTARWIVIADFDHARLLHVDLSAPGGLRLREMDRQDAAGKEPGQSNPAVTPDRADHSRRSADREHLTHAHQAAHRAAHWIEQVIQRNAIARLDLFAPAPFLGALRKDLPLSVQERVTEHQAELTSLTDEQLTAHPAVRRALGLVTV